MPRAPRQLFAGVICHVSICGNDGMPVFIDSQDHRVYRRLLIEAKKRFELKIFHWNQMTTHVHFVVQQVQERGLSEGMQWIQACFARYFNKRYRRSGHVWEGRFWARTINSIRDLIACARYVERNPVEAEMVKAADNYPWSSAQFYTQGLRNDLIDPSPAFESLAASPEGRRVAWKALLEYDSGYKPKRAKQRSRGMRPSQRKAPGT